MIEDTTVRTSSSKALAAWKAAQQRVQLAGLDYANHHTAAAKKELRAAQDAERKALMNYTQSRLAVYGATLDGTVRRS